jgi:hypothetical protein
LDAFDVEVVPRAAWVEERVLVVRGAVVVAVAPATEVAVGRERVHREPVPSLVTMGVAGAFVAAVGVSIHATASCSVPLHATPTPSFVALGASIRARCGEDPIHQIVDALLP